MKKVGLLFILVLSLSMVTAMEITLYKENYDKGETIIASISGNFLEPIKIDNVGVYRGHVQLPIDIDMILIDETYYIAGKLPLEENNYTIKIKDVNYREFNQVKEEDIEVNFSTINNTAEFALSPGVIFSTGDFDIDITNYNNFPITLSYTFGYGNKSLQVPTQDSKTFKISTDNLDKTFIGDFYISSLSGYGYLLPSYIIINSSTNNLPVGKIIDFSLKSIDAQLNKDESYIYKTLIKNNAGYKIEDIEIYPSENLADYITITPNKIKELDREEELELTINVRFKEAGKFDGKVIAENINDSQTISLFFEIGQDINISSNTNSTTTNGNTASNTCSNLGGNKCSSDQRCSGDGIFASDGFCCLGQCQSKDSPGNTGDGSSGINWWAIALLVVILVLVGISFFLKSKKGKKTARDVLKDREKSFSDKYETRGKLRNL